MGAGGKVWSAVLALALVGCASAGATDLEASPPRAATSAQGAPASTSTSTSTTSAPASTVAPPTRAAPPRVDCEVARCIALTFDDGPAPTTPALLDVLAAKAVPATFFLLGLQVEAHPEIVERARAEGHEIGNHTYDHRKLTTVSLDAAVEDVRRGAQAIEAVTGEAPTFVRSPQGATSAALREAIGSPEVLWSLDPEDWLTKDTGRTILRVVQGARPGGIVLLHDIYRESVAAVAPIIDHLRSQGYTFVTVSDLLGPDPVPGRVYREGPAG